MLSLDSLSCPIEKKQLLHPNLLCINFFTLMVLLVLVILVGLTLFCRVGIGIRSGVVLTGPIGPQEKNGYPFIGKSSKATYSLNVMANSGEIVTSKEVYQSIEDFLCAEPLPLREIKPRTGSWEDFRVHHRIERRNRG
jgi:class 3 adenylate cyclase